MSWPAVCFATVWATPVAYELLLVATRMSRPLGEAWIHLSLVRGEELMRLLHERYTCDHATVRVVDRLVEIVDAH